MNSTPDTKDVLSAHADEQLARVRERIASADEEIARVTEQLSKMQRDDVRSPSAGPVEDVRKPSAEAGEDARSPPARPDPQPPQAKSATPRSVDLLLIGLLVAACLVVAALASQVSLDGITMIAARWIPQRASTSFSAPTNPPSSTQPAPSTAEVAPAQAAPPAPTAPQDAASAAAGLSELTQLQQAMARDVADLKREIEQLKVKQDQIASDNSKAIEQLKAKQEDMLRLRAQVSEQTALPKTSPPSAAPAQSSQARMRPLAPPRPRRQYPPRWQYDDDGW